MDLTITPRTVQLETVKKLREAIISGHFKAGARLVETDLCKQLGVSRTSVREAIRVLSSEKLLILVPNKGPSVADISAEEAAQIYHVRKMLEGEAAALAAKNGARDNIAEMKRALESFEQAVEDDDAAARISATSEFYEAIIRRSGNQVIGDLIHGLLARVNLLRARTMSIPGRAQHSASELRKIYEAIAAHDARGARAAAVEHVAAAYKEVKDNLELPH
ncbi:GntR family transcriptional regulator [Oxalobacteraceae bacterium CAVE-383]|nr:GntR family transcriptional regulator [Oxalobacteraceae bacterium CAVE-383]